MFEPNILAQRVFPHRLTRLLKVTRGLATRVILLSIFVLAALNPPSAASEPPPILPNEAHPTADKQVMVAIFDEADKKWKVSELTGPEPPMSLQSFGEQNIWIFYGVRPSAPRKGTLSIKVSRVFEAQNPLQTDYSLTYVTTELGSWIPFYIGTGGSFSNKLQQITIVVTDLGATSPGVEVTRILMKSK